jgi:transglutaminase-like putative cysteine protease
VLNRAINRLSVLCLLLLGVLPQVALVAKTLDCGVDKYLPLWLLGCALCFWIAICIPHGMWVGVPAMLAFMYAAARYFDANPVAQLDDLIDRFSGAYFTNILYKGSSYQYQYLNAAEDHSYALLLAAFLLMAYLCVALTSGGGMRFMCLLGSVPFPMACLLVNGRPPYGPVVAIMLFWALVLTGGEYDEDGIFGRSVFGMSMPLILLLVFCLWINHPESYDYEHNEPVLSERLDRIAERIREWMENSDSEYGPGLPVTIEAEPEDFDDIDDTLIWGSASGRMDMTEQYDPQLREKRFFSLRADESGVVYLRAVSYGDYLGTGWAAAPEAPCSSLSFAAEALRDAGRVERRLSIRMDEKLRYALVPYFSTLSDADDEGIPGERQPERPAYYSLAGSVDSLRCGASEEAVYSSFAHTVYTRLPESTRAVMLSLAAQGGLDPSSPSLIDEVAAYIRSAGVYDIETSPYLSDDYAVCFLTQAQRGYCVHFATAAVAMYRALGVPARMTEGFFVEAERGRYVDVMGAQAHAWAEVYLDGLGWLPVEVTGHGGLNDTAETNTEPTMAPDTSVPPTETPAPQAEAAQESGAADPLPVGIVQGAPNEQRLRQTYSVRSTIRTVLLLALLLAALPVWRRVHLALWRARMEQRDPNKAAVAVWKRSQNAARFGGEVPAEIRKCAEKACFSEKGISAEERDASRALLDRQISELYPGLPRWKRFLFRYFFGLK